jgi:hypothetical protein
MFRFVLQKLRGLFVPVVLSLSLVICLAYVAFCLLLTPIMICATRGQRKEVA